MIGNCNIDTEGQSPLQPSVSIIGTAMLDQDTNEEQVFAAADRAMYEDKRRPIRGPHQLKP